jgi:hypothetical protein
MILMSAIKIFRYLPKERATNIIGNRKSLFERFRKAADKYPRMDIMRLISSQTD